MFSIVIPAKNESAGLSTFLPELRSLYPEAEIIVIDDGSTDNTREVCISNNVNVISHPYSKGNGAAIKTGARAATQDVIVFMDGDGQHNAKDVRQLLAKIDEGHDMVIGARQGLQSQANISRGGANALYNWLATLIVGHKVEDLTSGFRAVRADKFREFLYLLPNGFSYPTTCTMAFFRAGYSVSYIPILANKRLGKSHIRIIRDGVRFLLIIFKIGTLYSPLKVFFPTSLLFFSLASIHYAHTYIDQGRFTNMSALLYITSVLIFAMGLISEQVTSLMYQKK
ncbi:glycosyltransferase [Hahella sp. KA22]|uniref:glycosyltransferase family 2 protein n=1 Tax=Hahella sp. KA22 TaxID=1628392 RepID=UPI000FDE2D9E|nr:glycosyltransferase family 2 protein [Hahella sp. KA22]AZZ90905.1 glycosyltransferase family 2 protein [Hahella sp. KA22]QAY54275.1 glycosyltransferase [Hahella sp. KA22]